MPVIDARRTRGRRGQAGRACRARNPVAIEDEGWKSPTTLEAYKANFDVLRTAFGEDRLIWGSNWPVSDIGGDFGKQIELAEEYLKPFGPKVRDKVMFGNARDFYRRKPPAHTAR